MGARDPEQAILEKLALPAGQWEPDPTSPGGIRSGIGHGNPFEADPATIQLVKHRQSEQRHLYLVTFEGTIAHLDTDKRYPWSYVFPVEPDPDGGWRVRGGAGGAGDEPHRSTPWVNLAGGSWPDQFYAGGHIHSAGIAIASVELRFANNLTLQDDTEGDVALFISDQPVEMPATLALLDQDGKTVATQRPFPGPE